MLCSEGWRLCLGRADLVHCDSLMSSLRTKLAKLYQELHPLIIAMSHNSRSFFVAALLSFTLLPVTTGVGVGGPAPAFPFRRVSRMPRVEKSVSSARSVATEANMESFSDDQSVLAEGIGWHEIPNTTLASICPSLAEIQGNTGCSAVLAAWSGGVADIKRNRLVFWGGGHSDYFGNEVYALNLRPPSLERLTDPSPVSNVNSCPEAYADGHPSSRHTYDGLVFVPERDAMFSFGGSKSSCGSMSQSIWELNLATLQWTLREPHRGAPFLYAPGISAEYDPNAHAVFFSDTEHFFRYDPASNNVQQFSELHGVEYQQSGVLDPEHKLFLIIGYNQKFSAIRIDRNSKYNLEDWSKKVQGCEPVMRVPNPGLAYDPVQHVVVAWVGGNSVYLFNPDSKVCTEKTFPAGPGKAQEKGTNGRFRYFPALGVFALVNDWRTNAYVLRLTDVRRSNPEPGSSPQLR